MLRRACHFSSAKVCLFALAGMTLLSQAQQPAKSFLPESPGAQAIAQAVPPPSNVGNSEIQFNCPGSFPSDLTLLNCRYTGRQRLDQFLTTGVTDEAMAQSIFGSIFTQYATHSPGEWPQDWTHYGYRVGTSYAGSVGRASAELIVGFILHDDPRHIKCSDDPQLFGARSSSDTPFACTKRQRFFHALLDSITVRPSSPGEIVHLQPGGPQFDEKSFRHSYRRLPALDRLVGVYAAGYAQYPWQPRSANTFGAISQRAALSFGTTFLGSFYTEYGSAIFSKRKKKPQPPPSRAGSSRSTP